MHRLYAHLSWLGRLFLGLAVAVGAAILVLVFVPRTRPYVPTVLSLFLAGPEEPQKEGAPLVRGGPADALVVVSHVALSEAAEPGDFDDTLWSYAWVGLLEQEFGPPAVLDLDGLRPEDLEGRRLVVFTRSATQGQLPRAILESARDLARQGATLLVELPSEGWSGLTGLVLSGEVVNPAARFWRGQPLEYQAFPGNLQGDGAGPSLLALRDMPVQTWLKQGLMWEDSVRPLGRLSGQPLLYARPEGRGAVLTLGFDLACQVHALQQGAPPGPGFQVSERDGLLPGICESQDLVLGPTMLDNRVPYADLLEGWIADLAEEASGPLPGWWRFPFAWDGVAVLSHDEEERGQEGFRRLVQLEGWLKVPSTVFVLAGRSLPRLWPERNSGLELHWNRFMSGSWPPYEWPALAEQVARVEAVRGSRPLLCRIHFLDWGPDYAAPFRQMAAAGLELDSTYGPNRGRGYLFGTGLPFQALDHDGLPLPVLEWPFVAQEDWAGADEAFTLSLLEDSRRAFHQAPVLLLHPHRWVATASGRRFLEKFVRQARLCRHWVASMAEYHRFLAMRSRARLRSRLVGGFLLADLEAPGPGLALRLPDRLGEVELDGRPARVRRLRLGDRQRLLVEVPPGRHLLRARWEG